LQTLEMAVRMKVAISCMCYLPEIMIIVSLMNSQKVSFLRLLEFACAAF